jgi:predicted RNase H-like HicB family nuclease
MAVLDECPSLHGFSSQEETVVDTPEMTEAAIGSHLEVEAEEEKEGGCVLSESNARNKT